MITRSKRRRGILEKIHPIILFIERGIKFKLTIGGKSFDDFRLMIVDPPQKLDSEESNILSGSSGISSENISNKVI